MTNSIYTRRHPEDLIILSQPERMTFYNLAATCATCESPRVSIDDRTCVADLWASNEPITEKLASIFYEMKYPEYSEEVKKVQIFPVVYFVSQEERNSAKDIEELENKFYLSSALMVYPSSKSTDEFISIKGVPYHEAPVKINYNIILEQSLDGYVVPLKEIIAINLTSALNYNRGIRNMNHLNFDIEICLPESLLDEIRRDSNNKDEFETEYSLVRFLGARFGDNSEDFLNKFNQDRVSLKILPDATPKNRKDNFPAVYWEIMEAYETSFKSNPIW